MEAYQHEQAAKEFAARALQLSADNAALRILVIKYQQWSFTLNPLSDMEEIQRNELADEAEALGCREQEGVNNADG